MTHLPTRMLALAGTGHPRAVELQQFAQAITTAERRAVGGDSEDIRQLLDTCWRATKLWLNIGEQL